MHKIKIGIIGGSGMENMDIFKDRTEKNVTTIFGDPSDSLIEGTIGDVPCILLSRHGRKHSIMPGSVNYRANIWALKEAGCTHLIVTTATGSLKEEIKPGDFVVPDGFIDRTVKRETTFYDGQSLHGVCHLPMEPAFCERTRKVILETAKSLKVDCHESGTIVVIEGPRFSSKAESNMNRLMGGHLVNMTTVPEVVLAKEAGLCYAAIAVATDYDCWKTQEHVNVADVLSTFAKNVTVLTKLLVEVVQRIALEDWNQTIEELKNTVQSSILNKSE